MKHCIVLSALACVTALAPATDASSPEDPFRLRNAFLIETGKELRAHGVVFQTFPYTKDASVYAKLLDLGVMSLATDHPDDDPNGTLDAVVVGFDLTLTYPRLCRAAWWIQQGKLFVATNPDRVCPTDQPTVLVDGGAICALLEKATGRAPDIVLGKPDPAMLSGILERHGLRPAQIAMVGHRIYTDILMAHRAEALGVLVLTGEATEEDVKRAELRPHLVVPSLAELGTLLADSQQSAKAHP